MRHATANRMTDTAKSGYWEKGILSTAKSRARIQRMKAGVSILPESGVGWEWIGYSGLHPKRTPAKQGNP